MKLGLKQNVTVPRIFFRYRYLFSVTNFFRYCYLFPGPNVSVTGTSTFSGPICSGTNIGTTQKEENSREFSGTSTKLFRYRYWYFFRDQIFLVLVRVLFFYQIFPVLVPSKKEQNSRDQDVTLWLKVPEKLK